jgi:hypothetical protein
VADRHHRPPAQGKLYLCAIKDVCLGRIVGYSIDPRGLVSEYPAQVILSAAVTLPVFDVAATRQIAYGGPAEQPNVEQPTGPLHVLALKATARRSAPCCS